ncbi:TraR/DksA family transcriptional regulator [Streptomyces sp. NPDC059637]
MLRNTPPGTGHNAYRTRCRSGRADGAGGVPRCRGSGVDLSFRHDSRAGSRNAKGVRSWRTRRRGVRPYPPRAVRRKRRARPRPGREEDRGPQWMKTGAKTVVAKKTAAKTVEKSPVAAGAGTVPAVGGTAVTSPGDLAVRPGEDPWTAEEVEEIRTGLAEEAERLREELVASEETLSGLMRDSGGGAGDDEADTGTKNISREHELSLAANAREMLRQTEHALERLQGGTFALCESCAKPIGKARLQAFPRATLCVECKQRQERR